MKTQSIARHYSPTTSSFATAALTAVVALSVLGPRPLDADGDDGTRSEKARIAAAMPDRIRASAKLVRDAKSPSGWSAVLSAENPTDEDAEIHTDLAIYEARGNEMSREGPVAQLRHEVPVKLTVKAHGNAEARIAVPKGKLSTAKARIMRQAYATVVVKQLIRPDGTVVAAAPELPSQRMGLRRVAVRMPPLVQEAVPGLDVVAPAQANTAEKAPAPAEPNQPPAAPPPAQAAAPQAVPAAAVP